jgi:peptidoglycan/LPS O-acetylase OafA/YrhL
LATAVAAGHAGLLGWELSANLAVQIFFALSGWLIGGILFSSKPGDLPRFYFNRAARIWIPYFIAIGLLVAVSLVKDQVTSKWIEFVTYKLTFVYNLFAVDQVAEFRNAMPLQGTGNHFWSICAEEQFYLVAPLFIILLPVGRSIWFWAVLALGLMISPLWGSFTSIALGVLAVVIRERLGNWHQRRISIACLGLFAVAAFGLVYADIISYRAGAPLVAISVVLALAQPGHHSRIAEFLGGVSYPMYLNHWIGAFVAHAVFARFGMRGTFIAELSSVLIAFLIACALYLTIDQNIRRHRDRYFTIMRGRRIAAVGYALVTVGLIFGMTR